MRFEKPAILQMESVIMQELKFRLIPVNLWERTISLFYSLLFDNNIKMADEAKNSLVNYIEIAVKQVLQDCDLMTYLPTVLSYAIVLHTLIQQIQGTIEEKTFVDQSMQYLKIADIKNQPEETLNTFITGYIPNEAEYGLVSEAAMTLD